MPTFIWMKGSSHSQAIPVITILSLRRLRAALRAAPFCRYHLLALARWHHLLNLLLQLGYMLHFGLAHLNEKLPDVRWVGDIDRIVIVH